MDFGTLFILFYIGVFIIAIYAILERFVPKKWYSPKPEAVRHSKGTTDVCKRCQKSFILKRDWALYCDTCSPIHEREAKRDKEKKRLKEERDEEKRRLKEDRDKEKRRLKEKEHQKSQRKRISAVKRKIKKLLKDKAVKMPASDIDAHLKHKNVDEVKKICEELYHNGKIGRTGNYRYFAMPD